MKATATAHPIQGLVKYHGMRDPEMRFPYHDSISVCTAPSRTTTTVEWQPDASAGDDDLTIDGESVEGRGAERVGMVADHVRELADFDHGLRVVSENSFPSNVGFGSSSSGFAALAVALVEAAGLDMSHPEMSAVARRGSSSAARAVTGAYSCLYAGLNDEDCRSERLAVGTADGSAGGAPEGFDPEEDLRVVTALVPAYKETEAAHEEAEASHMFDARLAHVHEQLQRMRDALRDGSFPGIFELAEHDSLSLTATTMTGPAGWVYWQPETLAVFNAVRELREEEDVPVYFSTDTGASVYVNTTADAVDRVERRVAETGVDTEVWEVGGPAEVLAESKALF
ncbi:phosphomevalonate decarboxylase MvaD [Candidatus Halobonum tyrrellensis]|uniref:Diphosphomevalonate decarboxylase n=1 Tax=Candidatus Halobonum tyrrellensis G22 TaxID=1324957 RepID=V4GTU9_9EURY|nr:phosphomevalonate decarboxylase MvaD [Candidatus Halobonum tyrrellensis]ESP88551.1 diphosphomevalonate decarboxylase [Candidatus Halobonum tyrrellensis G22]